MKAAMGQALLGLFGAFVLCAGMFWDETLEKKDVTNLRAMANASGDAVTVLGLDGNSAMVVTMVTLHHSGRDALLLIHAKPTALSKGESGSFTVTVKTPGTDRILFGSAKEVIWQRPVHGKDKDIHARRIQ